MRNPSIACLLHNLRRLFATPRAIVVLIVTLLFVDNQVEPIRQMLVQENLRISLPGLSVYLLSDPFVTMMLGLFLLMLLFDAPPVDETQRYLIVRTGRGAWARGQVLTVLAVTVLYLVFVVLAQLILLARHVDGSGGWSAALDALVNEGAYEYYNTMLDYDPWILRAYAPVPGALIALALHALAYAALALIQSVVNLFQARRIGFLAAAAPLFFDLYIQEFFEAPVYYYSPVTLSRLVALDYGDDMGRPPLWYAGLALTALVILLAFIVARMSKRREIAL